ncbi:MAG: DUF924 domain-containing protein [Gammaproteobacteria bacterium]|nr:DUF924 domain-containing protein [Gammaproteobacteria bacterium]
MIQDSDAVIEYWLDMAEDMPAMAAGRSRFWYGSDEAVDQHMRRLFGETLDRAESGMLDNWILAPRSALALVLLLDQFSRNLYRGTPDAFRNDPRAREIARELVRSGDHLGLSFLGRAFLYHPFEHSEAIEDQNLSVELFTRLLAESTEDWQGQMKSFLDYAVQHRQIIEQFGRFPHRNAVLGRPNTPAEAIFLEQDSRRWGQPPESENP